MKLRKYTQEQLINAVAISFSFRQTLNELNIVAAGGNYATLKKAIKHFNLDISHFKGRGWNKGLSFPPKRSVGEYLSNKKSITSYKLKNRLLKEGLLLHMCSKCMLRTWLEKPIPLELHHIDGNSNNNTYENLELLCPNCHTFTSTYRRAKMS